jgi:RNA polymerase sigma-70 factor (ECF subfamily)
MEADAALLRAAGAGDEAALAALYRRHAPWLAARLSLRAPGRDLVEETLQETFLVVWRKAGGYRDEGGVAAWLWGIARRVLANQACKRRVALSSLDDVADPADATPGPEQLALSTESTDRVRRAIERLPADQREAIMAVVDHGRSLEDIARASGVATGTVKSRLFRARERIREELAR